MHDAMDDIWACTPLILFTLHATDVIYICGMLTIMISSLRPAFDCMSAIGLACVFEATSPCFHLQNIKIIFFHRFEYWVYATSHISIFTPLIPFVLARH
jgi:hypothetical protein